MNKLTHIKQSDRGVDDELQRIVSALNLVIDKVADPSTSFPSDTGKESFNVITIGNNEYSLAVRTTDGIVHSIAGIFQKSDTLNPNLQPIASNYKAMVSQIATIQSYLLGNVQLGNTKVGVKIEGTQDSPETFTTNVGKLQYQYGSVVFPPMDTSNYIISILSNAVKYQDANINQVGGITQVGNNISFQLAMNNGAMASSDGSIYADITILRQPKSLSLYTEAL